MTRRVLELLGPSTGGIRRHVAVLSSMLVERGWEVDVAGPAGVLDGLDHGGASWHTVPVPASMDPRRLLAARRAFRALRSDRRWNVVHAHGLKAGWVAVLSRPGCPIVLTIHNVVLDEVAGRGAAVQRRLERALFGRVDRIIAVSPEIVRHVGDSVAPEHIEVVLPASPPPVPRRDRAEVRRSLGIADDAVLVVAAARLNPQKDLPLLIAAWRTVVAAHPDARAVVVGEGPLREELERIVDEVGVGGSFRLAGPSPHAVDELAAADVVVLSSRWEGAPLVVAEAMQLGRPVVSTRVGVVPEMIGDGGAIVDVGDEAALASELSRFVGDAELRRNAGAIGRERGTVIYGADPLVDRVAEIYEEVVRR